MISTAKISQFYHWWVSEILDMLPHAQSISLNQSSDVQIMLDRTSCALHKNDNAIVELGEAFSAEKVLSDYTRSHEDKQQSDESCDVYVSPDLMLKRVITLPLATEDNIEDVISYELDRYTPFKKEDVYFDVDIQQRDKLAKKLTVQITVVKRKVLDEVLNFSQQAGLSVNRIFSQARDGRATVELFFTGLPSSGVNNRKRLSATRLLVISCIVLALVAMCLPIAKNYWLASRYQNDIRGLTEQVDEIKQLRSRFQAARKQTDHVNSLNSNHIRSIELLNELTELIPDDTSLARFSLENNIARIQGVSASASRLIAILDSSVNFSEVEFAAPVTKNSETNNENFTIQIKLSEASNRTSSEASNRTSSEASNRTSDAASNNSSEYDE